MMNALFEPNKAVARRYVYDFVNTGKCENLSEVISPEFMDIYSGKTGGAEIVEKHIRAVRSTYPDLFVDILDQYCDRDYVISTFLARATHSGEWLGIAPTQRQIRIQGVNIDRIVDGRIVEHNGFANTLEALLEIDALPGIG